MSGQGGGKRNALLLSIPDLSKTLTFSPIDIEQSGVGESPKDFPFLLQNSEEGLALRDLSI
jgi:hypothetical protein